MSEQNTNRVTLAQFDAMNPAAEDGVPLDQLHALQAEVKDAKVEAAARAKKLTLAILRRCEAAGRAALKAIHKDTGSTTLTSSEPSFNFKFEVPKKVEWDQAKLLKIVEDFARQGKNFSQISEYVTITLSVSEAKYNAWPSDIRTIFQDARMVKDAPATAEIVEAKKK